jgi:twitching motility protein PilT
MASQRTCITPQLLYNGLIERSLVDVASLEAAIPEPAMLSLNEMETRLVSSNLVPASRILQLKGALTGLPILDNSEIGVTKDLPARIVRSTGAFVLERTPLTVAFVEDTEVNIDAVAATLSTPNFDVWLITASQFDTLYERYYKDVEDDTLSEVQNIEELLEEGLSRDVSDIHMSVGTPPAVRSDGGIIYLPGFLPLTLDFFDREGPRLVGEDKYIAATVREPGAVDNRSFDADAAYTYGESRFRVNVGMDYNGPTIALRRIPAYAPSLDALDLPPGARAFCNLERGLVLVTGPTGSGKSTTLASMLSYMALTMERHIITLEDPIEFYLPTGRSVVNQRELGASFHDFPGGLRQALRQDPDVILVGELRDLETIRTALTAAETGHLVFATLHTYDASSTVSRMVSSFPADEQAHARAQMANILKGIISQTLLPRASRKGRVAAWEIMIANIAIQNNLAKVGGHNQLRQVIETSSRDGMMTMEASLATLVRRSIVEESDARFKAPNVEDFERRLRQALDEE